MKLKKRKKSTGRSKVENKEWGPSPKDENGLDFGKVMALSNAGWAAKEIAEDMKRPLAEIDKFLTAQIITRDGITCLYGINTGDSKAKTTDTNGGK